MADFSKEYCERYDFDMPYDFSVMEIFDELEPGYYQSCICEGYGFVAILKTKDGVCEVAFMLPYEEEDEQRVRWVPFDQVTKDTCKIIK
jgi:hypothetical protein